MTRKQAIKRKRPSNEQQQQALQLHRAGVSDLDISRIVDIHVKQVEVIVQSGIVALRFQRKPVRCGCGALLAQVPCLHCQLVGVGS